MITCIIYKNKKLSQIYYEAFQQKSYKGRNVPDDRGGDTPFKVETYLSRLDPAGFTLFTFGFRNTNFTKSMIVKNSYLLDNKYHDITWNTQKEHIDITSHLFGGYTSINANLEDSYGPSMWTQATFNYSSLQFDLEIIFDSKKYKHLTFLKGETYE